MARANNAVVANSSRASIVAFVGRAGARPIGALAALASVVVLLAGCAVVAPAPVSSADTSTDELAEQVGAADGAAADGARLAATALDVLAGLEIAPKTEWDGHFDRQGSFGETWLDPDGNGCDARNDALRDALTDVTLLNDGCRVASGVFTDPYSGQTVDFERGPDTSDDVQIDHVVALYNSWRTGAQDLTFEERLALANDPLNLQPTLDWVNDEKASSDASQWLPPDDSYHCIYVSRQIAVKATYRLWVTQNELDAMVDVLEGCA